MISNMRLRISGVLAAILFSIGYAAPILIPGGGSPKASDFADFYGSDARMRIGLLLVLILIAGAWALAWFFAELVARLGDDTLTRVASRVSLVGCAGLAVGAAIIIAPMGVQFNSDADFVGAPIAQTFAQAGLGGIIFVGMFSLALATALVSIAAHRQASMPRWLSIGGIVVAVLMIGSFVIVPGYLFSIWVLVIAFVGIGERRVA